jgi:ribosomal protein L37AE/L43A
VLHPWGTARDRSFRCHKPTTRRVGATARRHAAAIRDVQPHSVGCQECLDRGAGWVGLWLCLSCGWVACSDDSRHQHAKAHYHETDHAVVSLQQTPDTRWCHVHQRNV